MVATTINRALSRKRPRVYALGVAKRKVRKNSMANLTHLFKVKQKVKYHDPDTGKWHNGEIKETHPDHVIADILDISDHCWFDEDLNLEYLYPEYNFDV